MKYLPYIVIAVLILFIVFRPTRVERHDHYKSYRYGSGYNTRSGL